jgi:hypothetical protein
MLVHRGHIVFNERRGRMTVTKRLKLKLILLMLSSCSFSQHVPLTVMSGVPEVVTNEKKKDSGECTLMAGTTSGMMKPIVRVTAQARNRTVVEAGSAYESAMTPGAASSQQYQPEVTRYWECEQRSTVM